MNQRVIQVNRMFIIARLDNHTADDCWRLFREGTEKKPDNYSLFPHITLATLDVPDVNEFVRLSQKQFEGMKHFPVSLEEIGYYENISSVSILPKKEQPILEVFARATSVWPECLTKYYDEGPDSYLPHVTILHTGHMNKEELYICGNKMKLIFKPFTGYVTDIDYSLLIGEDKFKIVKSISLK